MQQIHNLKKHERWDSAVIQAAIENYSFVLPNSVRRVFITVHNDVANVYACSSMIRHMGLAHTRAHLSHMRR